MFLSVALFAVYFALGATGFGTDNDTYEMLRRGRELLRDGTYVPSRSPGYPLPEIVIAAAGYSGGNLLSNGISALLGVVTVACFFLLARDAFGARAALLSSAVVALNPWWVIASSSSMDYVYALAFFMAGVLALRHGRLYLAAPLFAAAVASRLTYLPLGLLAFGCVSLLPCNGVPVAAWRKRTAWATLLYAALSLAPYTAIHRAVGNSMFQVYTGEPVGFFSFDGYARLTDFAGRFVFKNINLWGVFGTMILVAAAGAALGRARRGRPLDAGPVSRRLPGAALAGAWAAVAYLEALFFRLPLEVPYLLPLLFPAVFLLNLAPRAPLFLSLALAAQVAYNLVSLELLEVRYAQYGFSGRVAEGARFRPSFGPGPLVRDISLRGPAEAHNIARFGLDDLRGKGVVPARD